MKCSGSYPLGSAVTCAPSLISPIGSRRMLASPLRPRRAIQSVTAALMERWSALPVPDVLELGPTHKGWGR